VTIVKRCRLKPGFLRATVLTIVLVVVYRLGLQISIPFVLEGTLHEFFQNSSYHRISIFALGLMPYVSAYILVEIVSLFIPPLKRLRIGDVRGRRRLKQIALGLALIFALMQGGGLLIGLDEMILPDGSKILDVHSTYQYGLLIAILMVSMYFLIGISELISKYGIGNGISILIFSGICVEFFYALKRSLVTFDEIGPAIYFLAIFILLTIGFASMLLLRTKISIPIRHRSLEKSLSLFQFNTCPSGKIAVTYAASFIMLPAAILAFFDVESLFSSSFTPGSWLYNVVLVLCIFVLSYVFAWLFLHPRRRILKLKKRGWEFYDLDRDAVTYLHRKLLIYNLPWTIFLCIVGVLPHILIARFDIPFYIGGTSLYIAIAIGLDVLDRYRIQCQAHAGRLVEIAEFHDIYDAAMIKKHMQSVGLSCHLQGYYHRQLLYFLGPYIDIRLMVDEQDLESAEKILKDDHNSLGLLGSD
jgi:preprotein translocase subunit SecY